MTTGEKIAILRKKKNLTQEQLAEVLGVARQSVSRWEMDVAFPETEKLIKLGKLLDCSIDFLLNGETQVVPEQKATGISAKDVCRFIRECGYFFLATCADRQPKLRPMGMIYGNDTGLYIATDKRKNVYQELMKNPQVELASYSLSSRKWIRITGKMQVDSSVKMKEEMTGMYPMIRQEYVGEEEMFLVIFQVVIEDINVY